jgi:hypothetical protein
MKRKCASILMAIMLAQATPTWALSAASVPCDSEEIRKAVMDEQSLFIQTAKPLQDPVKIFDDATGSCLDFIMGFQIGIPSMWDGLLAAMIKQLMQRVCQAARGQFDRAVNDAMQSVNGTVGQIPGVTVSTSPQTGINVQGDGGTTMQNTAGNAVNRVINFLK